MLTTYKSHDASHHTRLTGALHSLVPNSIFIYKCEQLKITGFQDDLNKALGDGEKRGMTDCDPSYTKSM